MNEPSIKCPNCGEEIKLTESLAAPLVEAVRAQYERKLKSQNKEIAEREAAIKQQADALERKRKAMDAQIAEQVQVQLKSERRAIAAAEAKKARESLSEAMEQQARELQERDTRIDSLQGKLKSAQAAEAELLRKKRQLEDAEREVPLKIERGVQEGLDQARQTAKLETDEKWNLKLKDRDHTIQQLSDQITDLKRRAEQGSQQSQGEVLELLLEDQLRTRFPQDEIEPVGKGESGADVVQQVHDQSGFVCGKILWESKRTKTWQDPWLQKLRADQRTAGADLSVIVSQALPKGVRHFDFMDGIWVTSLECSLPIAVALRQALIELANARRAGEGRETKVQQVYSYLTGPRFRQWVEVIVEKFNDMHEDLDKERKVMTKQWSKREEQIRSVIDATAHMYGDLQGIAGRSLDEIDALGGSLLLTENAD
ncbi:MAG TPA: DUF2130 domain-containing protein [Terracidiphilus sp.]|jgi:hypothetical protein